MGANFEENYLFNGLDPNKIMALPQQQQLKAVQDAVNNNWEQNKRYASPTGGGWMLSNPNLRNETAQKWLQEHASPLQNMQYQQVNQANDFVKNLPQTQATLAKQLTDATTARMNAQIKQNKIDNLSRGVGYGGVAEGQKQQIKSQSQGQLAGSIANMNSGLQDTALKMQNNAVQTGFAIQETNQAIQNQIYSKALADASSTTQQAAAGVGLLATIAAVAAL